MPGPVPKSSKTRQRRNKKTSATTLYVPGPAPSKKDIPPLPARKRKWRDETVTWWNDFWASPLALETIHIDMHQLYILADLVDEYWRLPSKELKKKQALAAEIRLQRTCFGMTPLDRSRLQWEIERGAEAEQKGQQRRGKSGETVPHKADPRKVLESKN